MRGRQSAFIVAGVSLFAAPHAGAADLAVVNAGFENPPQAPGSFFGGNPPGWTIFPGSFDPTSNGVYNPGNFGYYTVALPEGSNLGFSYDGTPTAGLGTFGLSQVLADTLQPLTQYTLRVAVGDPLPAQGFNVTGFPGYQVQLLAGGVLLSQDNNSLAGTFPEGTFAESIVGFTSGASHPQLGQPLEIRLINLNPSNFPAESEVDWDNVRLAAIPEPASLGLIALTLPALLRRRR